MTLIQENLSKFNIKKQKNRKTDLEHLITTDYLDQSRRYHCRPVNSMPRFSLDFGPNPSQNRHHALPSP